MLYRNNIESSGYSVSIPEGQMRHENGAWYCQLQDGQPFSIKLDGPHGSRAGFEMYIQGAAMHLSKDGVALGMTFNHIPCILRRPAHTDRAFVFYRTYSEIGIRMGIKDMNPEMRGLVRIVIHPETQPHGPMRGAGRGINTKSASGAVGLAGPTGQEFGAMAPIRHTGRPVEFLFRLVCAESNTGYSSPELIGGPAYPKPIYD